MVSAVKPYISIFGPLSSSAIYEGMCGIMQDKQELYYRQISLAVENAIEFIDAGELLSKNNFFPKSFIMTSFAIEALGQAIQYFTLSAGAQHLKEEDLRRHDRKNEAYQIWAQAMPFLLAPFQSNTSIDIASVLSDPISLESKISLSSLSQALSQDLDAYLSMVEPELLPFHIDEHTELQWKNYRMDLLYIDPQDLRSSKEEWNSIKEKFGDARMIEDGSIFESLRSITSLLKLITLVPFPQLKYVMDVVRQDFNIQHLVHFRPNTESP